MSSSTKATEPPISGGKFAEIPARHPGDPYERLADLMQVIEELCPRWPARDTFAGHRLFLL